MDEPSVGDALVTVVRQRQIFGFHLYNQKTATVTGDQNIEPSRG
jgi:hypothetical protein